MKRLLLTLLVVLITTPLLRAQSTSALINQALDKQVKLSFNTTLPEAIKLIEQQTEVRIQSDPAIWDILPWGEQTNLSAKIENQTLREALTALTKKLGLTFVLKDEALELQPMPALRRAGHRANISELQAIDVLSSTTIKNDALNGSVRNLISSIDSSLYDQQSADPKKNFAIENRASGFLPNQLIELPRNATLLDALETIDRDTNITWYPWGKSIVLLSKEDWIRAQLNRKVTARYRQVDVGQALLELSQRAGVNFIIEPGAVMQVPQTHRTLTLGLDNASIQQALESIAGQTGLSYKTTDRGVIFEYRPTSSTPASTGPAGSGDPVVAMFPLNNGLFGTITASQLPADVRKALDEKAKQEIESLKQKLLPATQPTN